MFTKEPTTESPLFELDSVVVTPHLGASTHEAQDKAGDTIAEQVGLALAGDFVPFAVNVAAAEASETVRPFLPLAERLGELFASLGRRRQPGARHRVPGPDRRLRHPHPHPVAAQGLLRAHQRRAGVLRQRPASWPPRAAIQIRETATTTAQDYVNLITIRGGDHALAGTLVGLRGEARIVMVDDHTVDLPPARHMLVVRNDDRPGMIGDGRPAPLGEVGINIADMDVGQSPAGASALQVLATSQPVPPEVVERLAAGRRHRLGARRRAQLIRRR